MSPLRKLRANKQPTYTKGSAYHSKLVCNVTGLWSRFVDFDEGEVSKTVWGGSMENNGNVRGNDQSDEPWMLILVRCIVGIQRFYLTVVRERKYGSVLLNLAGEDY